jgi:hypothetical protein
MMGILQNRFVGIELSAFNPVSSIQGNNINGISQPKCYNIRIRNFTGISVLTEVSM